jgi:hypothetical protein
MGHCQRCGAELKPSNNASMILFGVGGALMVVVALGALIFLTRGTEIGGYLTLAVLGLSLIVSLVGSIWLIIAAFQVSGMWGIACMFFPLAQLWFLYKHTDRALIPFTLSILSLVLVFIASFALPGV